MILIVFFFFFFKIFKTDGEKTYLYCNDSTPKLKNGMWEAVFHCKLLSLSSIQFKCYHESKSINVPERASFIFT